jgi:hypothetical protein
MSEIAEHSSDTLEPPTPIGDHEIKRLAHHYHLRVAQIRGLIALYGNNAAKLDAAVRRLKTPAH